LHHFKEIERKEGNAAIVLRTFPLMRWHPSRIKVWTIAPKRRHTLFKNSSEIKPEMDEKSETKIKSRVHLKAKKFYYCERKNDIVRRDIPMRVQNCRSLRMSLHCLQTLIPLKRTWIGQNPTILSKQSTGRNSIKLGERAHMVSVIIVWNITQFK
jgi:hypothetical protein